MIKIKIIKKDLEIKKIEILGHANYDERGKDIVCSAVSTLVIASVNIILKINKDVINYIANDDGIYIDILKFDNTVNIIIKNMIDMLYELEKQYSKNIKIID